MFLAENFQMEADYDLVGDGISIDKVDPINQKRLLTFVNFYLSNVVKFLNQTSHQCETLLQNVDRELQRLEASMVLLESKLSSIPGLETAEPKSETQTKPLEKSLETKEKHVEINVVDVSSPQPNTTPASTEVVQQSAPSLPSLETDERYAKYFKMLKMGIPSMAVKQKMEMEGIDPSILDNPTAAQMPVDTPKIKDDGSDFGDSDSTESSFSD